MIDRNIYPSITFLDSSRSETPIRGVTIKIEDDASSDTTLLEITSPALACLNDFNMEELADTQQDIIVIDSDQYGSVRDFGNNIAISLDDCSELFDLQDTLNDKQTMSSDPSVICNSSDEDVVALTECIRTGKRRKLPNDDAITENNRVIESQRFRNYIRADTEFEASINIVGNSKNQSHPNANESNKPKNSEHLSLSNKSDETLIHRNEIFKGNKNQLEGQRDPLNATINNDNVNQNKLNVPQPSSHNTDVDGAIIQNNSDELFSTANESCAVTIDDRSRSPTKPEKVVQSLKHQSNSTNINHNTASNRFEEDLIRKNLPDSITMFHIDDPTESRHISISQNVGKPNDAPITIQDDVSEIYSIEDSPQVIAISEQQRLLLSPRSENRNLCRNPIAVTNLQNTSSIDVVKDCEIDSDVTQIRTNPHLELSGLKRDRKQTVFYKNPLAEANTSTTSIDARIQSPNVSIDPSPGTSNSSKSGIIILSDILIQKETHQLLDKSSPQKSNAKPINVDTDDSDPGYSGWLKKHHVTRITCNLCQRKVVNYKTHLLHYHTPATHICDVCNNAYKSKQRLTLHKQRSHP